MTDNEQIYDDDVILDEIEEAAAGDNNTGLYEHYRIVADAGQEKLRIDKFLFDHMQHCTDYLISSDCTECRAITYTYTLCGFITTY